MSELPQPPPRCVHLQSKSLIVHGEGSAREGELRDGVGDCWCLLTGRPLGPDHGTVGVQSCRDPGRGCYCEY